MRDKSLGLPDKVIRTYNHKRHTAHDHRTGLKRPLKETMDGDLDPFIEAMQEKQAKEVLEEEAKE